eukprot:TRINITY_DN3741_c0_g1_i1.p2 TRINITY_DN3741_c0_g1~~TRINITY_DN3741_c0_g1_i1.p2  ORF type:complete len:55 (-),score=10.40 TRINITY_DN3741_c0_g1_i1:147-311(-)
MLINGRMKTAAEADVCQVGIKMNLSGTRVNGTKRKLSDSNFERNKMKQNKSSRQ